MKACARAASPPLSKKGGIETSKLVIILLSILVGAILFTVGKKILGMLSFG